MSSDRTAVESKRGLRELFKEKAKIDRSTGHPIQKKTGGDR